MLLHQRAPNPGRKKYSPVTVLWQAGFHCIKSPLRFSISLMETSGFLSHIQIKESPMLACDKTHTHINKWAERRCRSVGMHPPEGAVPVREPLLWFREINNSLALVYFLLVLSHRFFPADARIAEDFSISIYIPSPEFLILFSTALQQVLKSLTK